MRGIAFVYALAWLVVYTSAHGCGTRHTGTKETTVPESLNDKMLREQMARRGIQTKRVLDAFRATPRHLFVPAELQAHAYEDRPLPIGYDQTISQPYIVALMTETLAPGPQDKVLEIGTGSAYQAAVLSKLAAQVFTIEIVEPLAKLAAATLQRTGCKNVMVRHGDGYLGWPERAPFDRILLTAAPPKIPQALIDQLKVGGRLVAPEGEGTQVIVILDKKPDGSLQRRASIPVLFVPMVRGTKR